MFSRPKKDGGEVQLLRDRDSILRSKVILDELAARSGQLGARDDLEFRLEFNRFSPGSKRKRPCLLLISETCGLAAPHDAVRGYIGAILLFEYTLLGLGLRLYTTTDTTGRRTLIAPAAYRSRLAALASRALVAGGAQAVVMSIQSGTEEASMQPEIEAEMADAPAGLPAEWSLIERKNPVYLPLADTYDSTLAAIGKKTRTQLRYYRRRAERELSCRFIPEAAISLDDFIAFNRQCMYPVSDAIARWRYEGRRLVERPFLQGLKDRDGQWLSIVGGRRQGDFTELEWQCNRTHLPASSLSTVIRSYLIEHEISLGMKRLYFEGGTPTSLRQSFVVEGAADLTVCRKTLYMRLVRRFAHLLFPPKNQMAQIFLDQTLTWHPCRIDLRRGASAK